MTALNLTALRAYLTPYVYSLLDDPSCFNVTLAAWNGSVVCLNSIVRVVQFQNPGPSASFASVNAKVYLLSEPYQNITSGSVNSFGV